MRRITLAIHLSAFHGTLTGWMVVFVFADALLGLSNSRAIAIMFIGAMILFTAALLLLQLGDNDSGS